ncbi:GNAT family N-acetyltransferase [Candidatus Kaiserbacteria bacterium]|nr:GNAT family N-acetyltransferase [Candidatus Kaiserbacteria bacterium]
MTTIRTAKESDWKEIRKLIRSFPKQLAQEHLPAAKDFFVAEIDGKIVGCCAVEIYSRKIAEVRSLAIKPGFRGRGIASALVKRCVAKAKAKGVLEVLAITGALEFFDKLGFKAFNREKFALFKVLR